MGYTLAVVSQIVLPFVVASLAWCMARQQRLIGQLLKRIMALEARPPIVFAPREPDQ